MQLRPYQIEAVHAVHDHLRTHAASDAPVVVIPTGGGKTPVIATLCRDAVREGKRVVVLAHVKELLEQSLDKLRQVAPEVPVGVYSASLGRRQLQYPVTVAAIQSIHKKAALLGHIDLVIIDEVHLVPPDGEGRYRTFLEHLREINPHVRLVGLTATPFRMKSGPLCGPDQLFRTICFEIGVKELIDAGYLSTLVTCSSLQSVDTSKLRVERNEFVQREVEQLVDREGVVRGACREIVRTTRDRRGTLIFAASIDHAEHVAQHLRSAYGLDCGVVSSNTQPHERRSVINAFREQRLRYLANVQVLTTGFDAPHVDCVALLRPTMSPGLYYQMCGRGFRIADGKTECLVLDFAGNIARHGPVDGIWKEQSRPRIAPAVMKSCPACEELIAGGYRTCPNCGYEFPPPVPELIHSNIPEDGLVVSDVNGPLLKDQHHVTRVVYSLHVKQPAVPLRNARPRRSMKVVYITSEGKAFTEWVCVEHPAGWLPRVRAERWWAMRAPPDLPMPTDANQAVELARLGYLNEPVRITARYEFSSGYFRIVSPLFVRSNVQPNSHTEVRS